MAEFHDPNQGGGGGGDFDPHQYQDAVGGTEAVEEVIELGGGVALIAEFCEIDGGVARFLYPSLTASIQEDDDDEETDVLGGEERIHSDPPSENGEGILPVTKKTVQPVQTSSINAQLSKPLPESSAAPLAPEWRQTVSSFIGTRLFACNYAFTQNVPPPASLQQEVAKSLGQRLPLSHQASMFLNNVEVPREVENILLDPAGGGPGEGESNDLLDDKQKPPLKTISAVVASASIPDYRARGYVRNVNVALLVASDCQPESSLPFVMEEVKGIGLSIAEAAEYRYVNELPVAAYCFHIAYYALKEKESGNEEMGRYFDSLELNARQVQELSQEYEIVVGKYRKLIELGYLAVPPPSQGGQLAADGGTGEKGTGSAPIPINSGPSGGGGLSGSVVNPSSVSSRSARGKGRLSRGGMIASTVHQTLQDSAQSGSQPGSSQLFTPDQQQSHDLATAVGGEPDSVSQAGGDSPSPQLGKESATAGTIQIPTEFDHLPRPTDEIIKQVLKELLLERGNIRLRDLEELCSVPAPSNFRNLHGAAAGTFKQGIVALMDRRKRDVDSVIFDVAKGSPLSAVSPSRNQKAVSPPPALQKPTEALRSTAGVLSAAKNKMMDLTDTFSKSSEYLWLELSGLQTLSGRTGFGSSAHLGTVSSNFLLAKTKPTDSVAVFGELAPTITSGPGGGDVEGSSSAPPRETTSVLKDPATARVLDYYPSTTAASAPTSKPVSVGNSLASATQDGDAAPPLIQIDPVAASAVSGSQGAGPGSSLAGKSLHNLVELATEHRRWNHSYQRQKETNFWRIMKSNPNDPDVTRIDSSLEVFAMHTVPRSLNILNLSRLEREEEFDWELPAQHWSEPWQQVHVFRYTNYFLNIKTPKGSPPFPGSLGSAGKGPAQVQEEASRRVLDVVYHAFMDKPFVIRVRTTNWVQHFQRLLWMIAGCWVNRGKPTQNPYAATTQDPASHRSNPGSVHGGGGLHLDPNNNASFTGTGSLYGGDSYGKHTTDCYIVPITRDPQGRINSKVTVKELLKHRVVFISTNNDEEFDAAVELLPKDMYIRLEGETLLMNCGGKEGYKPVKRYLGEKDDCPPAQGFPQDSVLPPPPTAEGLLKRMLPFTYPYSQLECSIYDQYAAWALMVVETVRMKENQGRIPQQGEKNNTSSPPSSSPTVTGGGGGTRSTISPQPQTSGGVLSSTASVSKNISFKSAAGRCKVSHITPADVQRVLCAQPLLSLSSAAASSKLVPGTPIARLGETNTAAGSSGGGGGSDGKKNSGNTCVVATDPREVPIHPRDLEIVASMATRMIALTRQ